MSNIPEFNPRGTSPEAVDRDIEEMLTYAAGMVIAASENDASRFNGVPIGVSKMVDGPSGKYMDIIEGDGVQLAPTTTPPYDLGIRDTSETPLIIKRNV